MGDPSGFFLIMLLPALLAAFIVQFFVSARGRAKVIIWTAVGWTAAVLLMATISGDGSLQQLIGAVIMLCGIGLGLALIGALIGSELSTLTRRLLSRSAD